MKFIRKNGRIIPIREAGDKSAPKAKAAPAKRKPAIHQLGVATGAAQGLSGAFLGHLAGQQVTKGVATTAKIPTKFLLAGAAIGAVAGSLKFTKKAKGETNKQVAKRVANHKRFKWV